MANFSSSEPAEAAGSVKLLWIAIFAAGLSEVA